MTIGNTVMVSFPHFKGSLENFGIKYKRGDGGMGWGEGGADKNSTWKGDLDNFFWPQEFSFHYVQIFLFHIKNKIKIIEVKHQTFLLTV